MRNYLFKGLMTLFAVIVLGSCTKESLDADIDRLPSVETGDVEINLVLADAGQDMPPLTRAIPDGGDGKFDESLIAFVFAEVAGQAGQYKFYSIRPVVKGQGANNFRLSLPGTLIGSNVRLHVYSNSMDILQNTQNPNLYTRFTRNVTTEAEVISALTLTTAGRWDVGTNYKRIPMYGKTDFALQASTTSIGTISLRRMLARVDVGLKYNGTAENSTPTTLNNFKIIHMLVYNTKNKGQLIAGSSDPSVPEDGAVIPAYQSDPQTGNPNSIIREVFLFEHSNTGADFKSSRPCIILYGDYCPDPVNKPTICAKGYYRIDFYKDGKYLDIIRNTLYRFDITSVSGVGHPTPEDALDNVASNVVINLQSYAMGHNETEFNGQDYLSVNKSTITIYRNRLSDNFTVKTSYHKGWVISFPQSSLFMPEDFTPFKEAKPNLTETLVTFNFSEDNIYPDAGTYEFFIEAGNLKKKMLINVIDGPAPADLLNFSIPPVLYFARGGGSSTFNVTTNIKTASFNFTAGQINHVTIPGQAPGDGTVIALPLTIQQTSVTSAGNNSMIEGSLQVDVIAGNADLSASSKIIQFTDPKPLTVHMAQIPAGGASSHRMFYVLPDAPTTGIGTGNHKYYVVHAENLVGGANTITAPGGADGYNFSIPENDTYAERDYFRFTVYPTVKTGVGLLSDTINIIGHKPPVVMVKQAANPEPTFTVGPLSINYDNLSLDVVVSQGLNVKGGFRVQSKNNIFETDDAPSQNITDNTGGTIALTTTFNRGNTRTEKVTVSPVGFNGSVRPGQEITVTQSGANHGNYNNLGLPESATVGPNVTTHTFKFTGMKNANMFEAKMDTFTNGTPGISFNVTPPIENMKYTLGDSEATYTVTFNKNDDINDKNATFVFYVYPINQNTSPVSGRYTRTLTQLKTDKSITFNLAQTGGSENPILKPYRLWNTYYIPNVSISNVTGAKLEIREGSEAGNNLSDTQISQDGEATINIPANGNGTERILYLVAVDGDSKIYQSQRLVQQPAINKQWGLREKTSSYGDQCTKNNTSTVNGKVYTTNDSRLPLFYNDIYLAENFQHPQSNIQFWYYFLETTNSYKRPFAFFDGAKEPVFSEGKTKEDYQYYRCIYGTLGNAKN